jgi:hypothetical protein
MKYFIIGITLLITFTAWSGEFSEDEMKIYAVARFFSFYNNLHTTKIDLLSSDTATLRTADGRDFMVQARSGHRDLAEGTPCTYDLGHTRSVGKDEAAAPFPHHRAFDRHRSNLPGAADRSVSDANQVVAMDDVIQSIAFDRIASESYAWNAQPHFDALPLPGWGRSVQSYDIIIAGQPRVLCEDWHKTGVVCHPALHTRLGRGEAPRLFADLKYIFQHVCPPFVDRLEDPTK